MLDILNNYRSACGWFDAIYAEGESLPISFRNNHIYSIIGRQSSGFGIRANKETKTGFSYSNVPSRINETVRRAISLTRFGEKEEFHVPSAVPALQFEPYSDTIHTFSADREIEQAEAVIGRIVSAFPRATVDMGVGKSAGQRRMCNSNGIDCAYRHSSYSVSISATLISSDGLRLSISEGVSSLGPGDYANTVDRMLWKLEHAQTIRTIESGKIPVVFTPKACASLVGIVASGLSARNVAKGISPFAGKLGEALFNSHFSLDDRPLIVESPHSYPFDDEGIQARNKTLIHNGAIAGFISDLKYAHRLGIEPSGNGSRGYSSLPAPSFSNIVIGAGERPFAEIIGGIKAGILVDQFIGLGQSNTITGHFSANLDCAYLILNGEITGRVKDCMIADNLFSLLADDMETSSDCLWYGSVYSPYLFFPAINFTA